MTQEDKMIKHVCADILASTKYRKWENLPHHKTTTVLKHSYNVAYISLKIANWFTKKGIKIDKVSLVRAAMLHDYFGYDARDPMDPNNKHPRLHGFLHPSAAAYNARKEFGANAKVCDMIRRHMFPMTFIPPVSREGWILVIADKYCANKEGLDRLSFFKELLDINRKKIKEYRDKRHETSHRKAS